MARDLLLVRCVMERIIIVAKPESAANELASVLRRDGFDAFTLDSADEAWAELAARSVDLVVLDLDRRTLDLARRIRAAYPATRVAFTGCVPLSERQLERLDCGALGFYPKPFDLRGAASFVRAQLSCMMHPRRLWHAEQPSSYAL